MTPFNLIYGYHISVNPAATCFHSETEAADSSETFVPTYKTARFNETEDHIINSSAFVNIGM
jgi:hypothetical protein